MNLDVESLGGSSGGLEKLENPDNQRELESILQTTNLFWEKCLVGKIHDENCKKYVYLDNILLEYISQKFSDSNLNEKIGILNDYLRQNNIIRNNIELNIIQDHNGVLKKSHFNPINLIGILFEINNILNILKDEAFEPSREITLFKNTYGDPKEILILIGGLLNRYELEIFKGYIDTYASKENQ